jgi:hypothetical protein
VTIAATAPNAAEPATNGLFTVTRTGDTSLALTVNYTVAGTATPGSDYSTLSGSVTIPIGSSSANITVVVLDDLQVESPETVIVTLTPSPTYTLKNPVAGTVTINDDDSAGFIVTSISGHTKEDGTSATFTVRLTSQPTAGVTIPLASSATTEGSVSPTSLLFGAGDWMIPKLVTVTGVNDTVTDGNVNYQILLGPVVSGDTNYSWQDALSGGRHERRQRAGT